MTYARLTCPHCQSNKTTWKSKASEWECQSCDRRFPGSPPLAAHRRLSERAAHPRAIFFSYGHDANRELVDRFKADFENRGHTVWIDFKEIGDWSDWKGGITRGIDGSELSIAFLSRHAMRDPGVCRNEIAIAMNRFGSVYPVLLEAGIEPDIPVTIRNLQWPDLSQWNAIRNGQVPGIEWERWYEEKFVNLIERLEGEATAFADESRALRRALRPSSFESKIAQHVPGFIGRDWVFDAYRQWLNDARSRLFWIKAGPGVGKSAIAANLASRERSAVVASWFIDAKSNELRSPSHALRSLAFQLAQRWEDYRVRLMRQLQLSANATEEACSDAWHELDKKNTQDLFRFLLAAPLSGLIWREQKLVIVIDALDEGSDGESHNRIAELIGLELNSLPDWIGFVVTSRPEADVVNRLQGFNPFVLDATDPRNRADLAAWYRAHLVDNPKLAALQPVQQTETENLLVERSEGMMLYLKVVEEGLREGSLTVAQLGQLESGLPGLYKRYYDSFIQRFGSDYETAAKPLLRLLLAAAGPLPEDLACAVLKWNKEQYLACRNRIGSFVNDSPDGQELFHKTLREWLASPASGPFFLDTTVGRQAIADVLFGALGNGSIDNPFHSKSQHRRKLAIDWLSKWWRSLKQRTDPNALHALASGLNNMGYPAKAEPLYREALPLYRITEHPDAAFALDELSALLKGSGSLAEAEAYLREALSQRKAALPAGHLDIACNLNTLSFLLQSTGRNDEAEALSREALEIRRSALPAGSADITSELSNLATLLESIGSYDKAETLYREAFNLHRASLPAISENRNHSRFNLANMLWLAGRSDEAESLLREELERLEITLPAWHPEIWHCLRDLSWLLEKLGREDESSILELEACSVKEAASLRQDLEAVCASLRPGHPNIAISLDRLADLLFENSRTFDELRFSKRVTGEAELLYRKALEIRRSALPEGHPDIVPSLYKLAVLLQSTDRPAEALLLHRDALGMLQSMQSDGAKLLEVMEARRCIAVCLRDSGEFDESFQEFSQLLDSEYQNIGREHELTLSTEIGFAKLLRMKGDQNEARKILDDALPHAKKTLGDRHSITKDLVELRNVLNG